MQELVMEWQIYLWIFIFVKSPPCCHTPEAYSTALNRNLGSRQLSMFKTLFKKIDTFLIDDEKDNSKEEKFFSNIVGYPQIKKLLLRSIVAKEPVHILLTGPPSSSKTVFLLEMLEGLGGTYFVDAVGASGAGVMDRLFSNNTKYLLIDEIDKMKKNDQ